jgi:predicted nucleic acid-binding protein
MKLVIDTSAIIAVLVREPHRAALINVTKGADLLAPPSVHWEVGNAFAAMFKRERLSLHQAHRALEAYHRIPLRFSDVGLAQALQVSKDLDIYAYDAYVIACALKHRCGLLSLDRGLVDAAGRAGVEAVEVQP